MGVLETYFHYRNSGIALVENASSSPEKLRALGADASDAAELARLHRIYFGPTRFTGKQRKARTAAQNNAHGLSTLNLIESYASRVKKELDAWNLRARLAATPAHKIRDVAVKRLKELKEKREHKPGVRFTYRKQGPNSVTITDTPTVIADIRGTLESVNPTNLLDAATTVILGGNTGTRPAVHAQVVVTLDEFDRIINGDGDEIELQLTNGARMTGAEFLTHKFASIGYATITHPVEGPINSYRVERHANWKHPRI
ncbi:HNH endonuclease [Corynebacterium sp.]|uniref:HNH endonuclease n=1 Tax=Corynebacterium sp. TaxID=1720 RepID=UPI0027BA1A77|nr:HNH endonuclease [Corynebacterium sp.]